MIALDPTSSTPPYEQVRAQVAAGVQAGTLAPGDRLPTVRGLAADLGVAAATVARAYRELEADGVVETRGRHGTVVADTGDGPDRRAREAAAAYAATVRRLGLPDEAALALVRSALTRAALTRGGSR